MPREDLEELASWARERGLKAEVAAYSDREFYLDIPEAFVDFVVEAMRPELADYGATVGIYGSKLHAPCRLHARVLRTPTATSASRVTT
jgi:hypothetical protein